MRIGVPPSSVNCFEGGVFFAFEAFALGTGAMRVPSPAAGMITITFMAACKYTSAQQGVQIVEVGPNSLSLRRLPELDAIPVWIHDPCKASVIVILAMLVALDSILLQLFEQRIQVIDAIV